jgi:hypothetical protein
MFYDVKQDKEDKYPLIIAIHDDFLKPSCPTRILDWGSTFYG